MKAVELHELRKIQQDILDVVADFCEAHNIHYWLDNGTLLGAIRHNGYIPWDDDIDIGMLRDDYDRFINEFNLKHDRYKVWSVDNNPSSTLPYAKVYDTDTLLYEPDAKGLKHHINIDVFVYDNAPDDEDELKKMFTRRDCFQFLNDMRTIKSDIQTNSWIKNGMILLIRAILNVFPRSFFAKQMSKNSQKYKNAATKRVGNFTSISKVACDKSVFSSFENHLFEGKYYKIPIGYDRWLKSFYGDYMVLPPVEKRITHHRFEAFISE